MTPSIYDRLEIPCGDRLASISEEEGEYLYEFIKKNKLHETMEIGFAYGVSTAYIMAATSERHVVIDPYEEFYGNLGWENIRRLGLAKHLIHIEELSHLALPMLVQEDDFFDFIFIDGGHRFEDLFLDWYYSDLMLKHRGFIIFHDAWLHSAQAVLSFIKNNRKDYRLLPTPLEYSALIQKTGHDKRSGDQFKKF